jgi:predicted outer membrane repeat protein
MPSHRRTSLLTVLVLSVGLALSALVPTASASQFTTSCTLQARSNPTTVGEQATFRFFAAAAAPTENAPPSPSGLVTFFDGLPIEGNILGTAFLSPAFDGDNNEVFFHTSDLSVGDHTVYAVLVPVPGFGTPCPGGPPSASHHVNPPPAVPSTTSLSSSDNPSKFNQNVTFTANVTRQGGGAVAGTVQFKADGNDLGAPQPVDGSGNASVSTSSLSVGNHPITADFTSTNANTLNGSGALAGGQTVQAADTQTGVSSSMNPSQSGQSVTFTAQVDVVAPGAGTPTGTVQFSDNGTDFGAPQTLDGTGRASVSTSALTIGAHTITATYTPANGNYTGSSGSVSQTVEKAKTTLTYDGATSGDFHDTATLSATLKRQYDSAPLEGKSIHFTMASESCDAVTNSSGKASCTIVPQEPAGDYTVAASFAGDDGFTSSSASTAFKVTREQTSLQYTGDSVILNGSPTHASALLREDDGAPAIAGRSVTFTIGTGATAQSCTALTNSSGRAACDIATNQPLGPNTIKSVFAQDAYYLASSDSDPIIVYAFPSRGAFAVGDRSAVTGGTVTYFSATWAKANSLSGGAAPDALKGFATSPGTPPRCGATFVGDPGNSGGPPATVPTYMGTLVTSKVTKSGSTIGGTVTRIVVVKTGAYGPAPGKGGAGTVVATVC